MPIPLSLYVSVEGLRLDWNRRHYTAALFEEFREYRGPTGRFNSDNSFVRMLLNLLLTGWLLSLAHEMSGG